MSDELSQEIYRQLRTSQDKYVYFILAVAGAAIALAINQTQGSSISLSQIPLAGAVLCWGLSFFFGCRHISFVSSTLYANFDLLKVESGEHKDFCSDPQLMAAAILGIRQAMEDNSNRANRFYHLQFRFLIVGALLYIAWHVLEMWLRT